MTVSPRVDHWIRLLAIGVFVSSTTYMAHRSHIRADITSEGLSRISAQTRELIDSIGTDKPVMITAYVSKEVPQPYVGHRARLLNLLRELEASGNQALTVRIFEPEPYSDKAQEAADNYGIVPQQLLNAEAGRMGAMSVFLGLAFSSGPREEVISFLDRGLSVEYELARALQTVVQNKKRVVGILRTDAHLTGNFDMATRRQQPAWRIVEELEKQYEVRSVNPGAEIAKDVDVLLVPQISSMSQPQLDHVRTYLNAGRPALVVADPMPVFDVRLSPTEPMLPPPGQGGGFGGMGMQQNQAEPKGDYKGLLSSFGVEWSDTRIIYDSENPNPRFSGTPPQMLFLTRSADGSPLTGGDTAVDGLAQVVSIYGGDLRAKPGSELKFQPLLTTGPRSGYHSFDDLVDRGNFLTGLQGPVRPRSRGVVSNEYHVLAARISGELPSSDRGEEEKDEKAEEGKDESETNGEKGDAKSANLIVLADLDMFSDTFFAYHERGGDVDGDGLIDIRFDNVTFLLNCIDILAGDERFIELRRRQPEFRRLERVDEYTKEARREREEKLAAANIEAEAQLKEAQAALDAKIEEIRGRSGIDETTKAIMASQAQQAESRRLQLRQEQINREKEKQIAKIETEHLREVDKVQNGMRLSAILLPPIPAIFMGLYIYARKRRRESSTIPSSRKRG